MSQYISYKLLKQVNNIQIKMMRMLHFSGGENGREKNIIIILHIKYNMNKWSIIIEPQFGLSFVPKEVLIKFSLQ